MLPKDLLGKIFHRIKKQAKTINVVHDGKLTDDSSFYQFDWDAIVSFDDRWAWVGELTSYRNKQSVWDWVARYRLTRSPAVDKELGIPGIIAERSKVIGGVRYGMTVTQLLDSKGMHFKAADHQEPGTFSFYFDDVVVTVKGWRRGTKEGQVVRAEPMQEHIQRYNWLRDLPSEDEN